MSSDGWITLAVTASIVVAMALNLAAPDFIMVFALSVLMATQVISPAQALVGFSNEAVLTVAALFVVAAGLRETGGLDWVARRFLGRPASLPSAQVRLMTPVTAMSAFLNNTPVVAMMVPLVGDWSRRIGLSPSKLLIPLSYAAILGGTCTLIGTSTNLVVAGMAHARDAELVMGMFEIAWLGLPVTGIGTAFVLFASRWLLPDRTTMRESLDQPRQYTVAMRVTAGCPVAGQTIEKAGLRQLPGLYLVEIVRGRERIVAAGPHVYLQVDDVLLFAGIVDSVVDLRKIRGLVPDTDQVKKLMQPTAKRRLFEAVIAAQSPLVGQCVREFRFRTKFNAAIIAVHRRGAPVRARVGDIVLEAGDTLLVEAAPHFERRYRNDGTFALVAEVEGSTPPQHERAGVAAFLLTSMVVVNVLGGAALVISSFLAAVAMLATRCLTGGQARRSIDLQVLVTIAAAFGIGNALDESGAAAVVARHIVEVAATLGPIGVWGSLYAVTAGFAMVVGNNAAAALMFHVAFAAAESAGLPVLPTLLLLMVAASASFATPIGYQTNLMVLGPGGYRFSDFFRIGVPLQVVVGITAVTVAAFRWL